MNLGFFNRGKILWEREMAQKAAKQREVRKKIDEEFHSIPNELRDWLYKYYPDTYNTVKSKGYSADYSEFPEMFKNALQKLAPDVAEKYGWNPEPVTQNIDYEAQTEIKPEVVEKKIYERDVTTTTEKPNLVPPAPFQIDKDIVNIIMIVGVGISAVIAISILSQGKKK